MTITRTSDGLRRILFDTLDQFLDSKITAVDAKTVAKLADSILKSAAVDLEHKRLVRELISDAAAPSDKAIASLGLNMVLVDGTKDPDTQ